MRKTKSHSLGRPDFNPGWCEKKKIKQHYVKPHPKQEWIPTEQRWYVNTGAVLKLYGEGVSGYAEVAGYDPIELGFAVVEVRDRMVQGVRLEVIK